MSNQTQEKQESNWRSRELGALWVRNGKNQKYLSGTINVETMPGVTESLKVVVFTNKGRDKNERAPDYVVYRSEDNDAQSNLEQAATEAVKEVSASSGESLTVSQSASPTESSEDLNQDIPEELF